MRKSRFTEEQIGGDHRGDGSRRGAGCCQAAQRQRADAVHMEEAFRRVPGVNAGVKMHRLAGVKMHHG